MIFNRHAKVVMEEGYMRLSVEYTNPKSRSIIFDAIEHIERDMDVHPEVIHRRLENDSGAFSIEFSGEDYICTRTSGEFIERVLKDLDIDKCDRE
jgi:hypothetical protein